MYTFSEQHRKKNRKIKVLSHNNKNGNTYCFWYIYNWIKPLQSKTPQLDLPYYSNNGYWYLKDSGYIYMYVCMYVYVYVYV